ncbi:uridine phosphorylase 1-like [Argonauta hians]
MDKSSDKRMVAIPNERIQPMKDDHLYHIGMSTHTHDLPKLFGDVKFVCMGGSAKRMLVYASAMKEKNGQSTVDGSGGAPHNFAEGTDRYAVYKVGQVLFVNHGIGIPSLSIVLQEVGKLLFHAGCSDVTFFRLGTCGGLGLDAGTVVISEKVVNWELLSEWKLPVLGKLVANPAEPDQEICSRLQTLANELGIPNSLGITMCCDDFYEGQGRIDGPFASFSAADKLEYLQQLTTKGVTNMEMESLGFVALCNKLNIPCAVICVTLLDRLKGDQVSADHSLMSQWERRPLQLFFEYINRYSDQ